MDNLILPETGFVRLPTILKVFPVSKSTWWAVTVKPLVVALLDGGMPGNRPA